MGLSFPAPIDCRMRALMKKSARTFARTVTRTVALSVSMTVAVLFAVLQTHPSITRASSTRGFDVNDVSVLLPVGPNGLHPSIALRDLGVFDDDIFEQVLRFEYPAGTPDFPDFNDLPYVDSRFVTDIKRWKLTSFRIEDCSEVIHAERESHPNSPATFLITRDPGCQPRIRMVVQPSNLFGISLPTAIHILANLEPAEFQTAVQDLKALQDLSEAHYQTETFGKTLGLHPGLSSELTHPGKQHSPTMFERSFCGRLNAICSRRS